MDNTQLVAKSHIENFNNKSQLVVNESQEAIFFKEGQALDLFGAGRHSLETANLPIFKRIFNKIFGGNTPFSCEVFFVNKVSVLDLLWGTDVPVLVEDPKYHLLVHVRANGQTGLRVKDSRKFVVKVAGQMPEITVENIKKTVKAALVSSIKEVIATAIVQEGVSILEITTILSKLSDRILSLVNEKMDALGLEIENFFINSLNGDDGDLAKLKQVKERRLEMMNEAELEAFKMTTLSEARAKSRAMEGYTYQDERRFDVLEGAAKNEGGAGGSFINMGVGLGMGAQVGREVGEMMNHQPVTEKSEVVKPTVSNAVCPNCQNPLPQGARFCSNCGQQVEIKPSFCSQCGNQCEPGAKFCPNCGNKL